MSSVTRAGHSNLILILWPRDARRKISNAIQSTPGEPIKHADRLSRGQFNFARACKAEERARGRRNFGPSRSPMLAIKHIQKMLVHPAREVPLSAAFGMLSFIAFHRN